MLLRKMILKGIKQMNNERTLNSIYYLIKGKPSIQTLQDAQLFQLTAYFSLYKPLNMQEFQEELDQLVQLGYVRITDAGYGTITEKALAYLAENPLEPAFWDGMNYRQIDESFIRRLWLIIQVWTNRQVNNKHYIPIYDDQASLAWAREFYQSQTKEVPYLLRDLYDELIRLFSSLPTIYPQLFIEQLTTDRKIGLTDFQLAEKFGRPLSTIHLKKLNYIHYILRRLDQKPEDFPLLRSIQAGLIKELPSVYLTSSAQASLHLLKQGFPLEEIARRRQLKITTIYDHIVEIALKDRAFSIDAFVPRRIQTEIIDCVKKIRSRKLKEIKRCVDDNITYFQIRLTLSKWHDQVEIEGIYEG